MEKTPGSKIILDLCGGTGSWSNPYKDAGYTVYNITHDDYDIFTCIYRPHELIFPHSKDSSKNITIDINDIYGILAAPPCTEFSFGKHHTGDRDIGKGLEAVEECLELIKYIKLRGDLKFWALENPLGYLRQFLGKPPLTFHPYEYGDNYTKRTDIWGYYNIPNKKPKILTPDEIERNKTSNRILPKAPKDYAVPKAMNLKQVKRSITSKYFAEAFFKCNK